MCFNTTILSENCALLQANKTIMTRNRNRLQQRKFKGPRYTSIFLYFVCLLFNPFSERIQWGAYRLLIKIQSITSSFSWCHTPATTAQAKAEEKSLENDDVCATWNWIQFDSSHSIFYYDTHTFTILLNRQVT